MALVVKNPPVNAGDVRDAGSIPESERSPEGGHGNPLQYSCLENPMDRGPWQPTVHRVTKSQTEWSNIAHTHADNHTKWTQSGITFQHYEQYRWLLNIINRHRRICSTQSNVEEHFFVFFSHLVSFWISHPLPNIHSKKEPTVDLTSPYEFTVWTGCFSLGSLITGKKDFFLIKRLQTSGEISGIFLRP